MSTAPRKRLVDVLGESRADLARVFAEAEAAGDLVPLPAGVYRCRLTAGELDASKGGTPAFTLAFTVDAGEHRGRKLWHSLWLTPAAMPMSKRDLAKLGVTSLEQLDRPLPACFACDVKVGLRVDDDGVTTRNRVVSFQVVGVLADATADADFSSPLDSKKESIPHAE